MDETPYPKPINDLIALFRELPGIGRRTAERLVLTLLSWDEEKLQLFGDRVSSLKAQVNYCRYCGNYAEEETCRICGNSSRDTQLICVVEQASQIPVIEQSNAFTGLYHVLGGRIDPLQKQGPEELRINELLSRLEQEEVQEVIIATGSDVEGEATASYVKEAVGTYNVRTSRIATGLPVGADLAFADAPTISTAIQARQVLWRDSSE